MTSVPLDLPLAGGSDGSGVRVHPLRIAEGPAPPSYFSRPSGPASTLRGIASGVTTPRSKWPVMPIPAFLVEHPTAGPFMVDTGVAPIVAEQGMQADLGPVGGRILNLRMERGWAAGDQIRELGFEPAQIELVVMTHLHFDHLGGAGQFPSAMFVVNEDEHRDAPSVMKGTYKHHRELVRDWRTYELPRAEWEGFSRTLDLFGDGSVRLVSTPGHTPGHVSIVLRLEGGRECLLVGDAAYARRSLDNREVPLICPDVHAYLRSLDELSAWVEAHPDAIVVCGHDPWEWPAVSEELRSHALAVR